MSGRRAILVRTYALPAHSPLVLRGRRATRPRAATPLPGRVGARIFLLGLRAHSPVCVHRACRDVVLQTIGPRDGHDSPAWRWATQVRRVGRRVRRDARERTVVCYWHRQRRVRGGRRVGSRRDVFIAVPEGISGRARRRRCTDPPVCGRGRVVEGFFCGFVTRATYVQFFFFIISSVFLPSYKIAWYYTISAFLFSPQLSPATRREDLGCCEASLSPCVFVGRPRDECSGSVQAL